MKSSILKKLTFSSKSDKMVKSTAIAIVVSIMLVFALSMFAGKNIMDLSKLGQSQTVIQNKAKQQQDQNWVVAQVYQVQQSINKEMTGKIREFRKGQDVSLLFVLLFTAGLYGFLHGIGPGHGKTVVAGWVLSQERTLSEITVVSIVSSFVHAFSSVLIVYLSYQALGKFVPGAVDKVSHWFQIGAGMMLMIIGLQIIVEYIMTQIGKNSSQEAMPSAQGIAKDKASTNPLLVAVTIGIVPCPLAAIIFAYCLAAGLTWLGLLMAGAFALGVGLSILAVAVSTWFAKEGVIKQNFIQLSPKTLAFVSVTGGILFTALGYVTIIPYIG